MVSAGVLTTWQLAPPSLQESDLGRKEAKSHTSTMPSSSGEYYQTQPTLMERRRRLHCSKRRKIKEFVGLFFFLSFLKCGLFLKSLLNLLVLLHVSVLGLDICEIVVP